MIALGAIGFLVLVGVLIARAIERRDKHKGPDPPYPPIPQ